MTSFLQDRPKITIEHIRIKHETIINITENATVILLVVSLRNTIPNTYELKLDSCREAQKPVYSSGQLQQEFTLSLP